MCIPSPLAGAPKDNLTWSLKSLRMWTCGAAHASGTPRIEPHIVALGNVVPDDVHFGQRKQMLIRKTTLRKRAITDVGWVTGQSQGKSASS